MPSGSRKIWWPSRSPKRTILSSIEGQYRGPLLEICPEYIGERWTLSRMTRWVAAFVRVMPHRTWGLSMRSVSIENGSGGSSPGCISTAAQPLQGERQAERRRLAHAPRRRLPLANMDEPAQEGSRGEHDGPCPELAPVRELEPSDALAANYQVVRLGFDHREIRRIANRLLHGPGIERAVCLRARSAHGRPLATIEHAKLDAAEIGHAAHQAVERVDLAHQMAFAQASDRGIARHRADGREAMGDERDLRAHARGRGGGLATSMAAAHDDDIVLRVHRSKFSERRASTRLGAERPFPKRRCGAGRVSRETCATGERERSLSATGPVVDARFSRSYLPIQKSRKITSRTSSTSTRPRSLPNALVASRSCSAMISSLPSRAARCAPSNASTVSLRCAR